MISPMPTVISIYSLVTNAIISTNLFQSLEKDEQKYVKFVVDTLQT